MALPSGSQSSGYIVGGVGALLAQKMSLFGQGLDLCSPIFLWALKLKYPMDVCGISRDGRVTTELVTSSQRQAVSILTPEDFQPEVDTE